VTWTVNPERPPSRSTPLMSRLAAAEPRGATHYPWCASGYRMIHPRSMPQFLREAPTMVHMECACGCNLDRWHEEIRQTRDEMFVRWSSWRLWWWELEMRLPPRQDATIDQRADRVIARMRAWRLPTVATIYRLSAAYGAVVWPMMNYEQHFITYHFEVAPATPEGQADLEDELFRITPARLGVLMLTFVVWEDYEAAPTTWCQPEDDGWTWQDMEDASSGDLPPLSQVVCLPTP